MRISDWSSDVCSSDLLKHGMSPEQIAQRLKQEQPSRAVSHEWIYRFIAAEQRAGGELYTYLRHRRKRYRKRYGSHDRRGQLRNRVSISEDRTSTRLNSSH